MKYHFSSVSLHRHNAFHHLELLNFFSSSCLLLVSVLHALPREYSFLLHAHVGTWTKKEMVKGSHDSEHCGFFL